VAAGVVAETTATAGRPWYGGREGHIVYEDDWVEDRSWYYHKQVFPVCIHHDFGVCTHCKHSSHISLKLHISGSTRGRLVPTSARTRLGFDSQSYRGMEIDLGEISVNSIRKAKAWAEKLATPAALKVLFQTYYQSFEQTSEKRGNVIQANVDGLGWVDWLWSFEEYPNWSELLAGHSQLRYRSSAEESSYTLVTGTFCGYSTSFWPSFWYRIRERGMHWSQPSHDEYGPL
jgi:hypothetical protein